LPSTPVTGRPVKNSTPRLANESVARWIKSSGNTGRIFGPASTSLMLISLKSTPYFSAVFGTRLSTISPTSSTPVKPPPPITIVPSAASFDFAKAAILLSIWL